MEQKLPRQEDRSLVHCLTCLLFKTLSSASSTLFRSGFRNSFILDFCSDEITIWLFLPIVWLLDFTRPNSRHTVGFLFSIFYFSYHFTFSFDAQIFLLSVTRSHVLSTSLLFAAGLEKQRAGLRKN